MFERDLPFVFGVGVKSRPSIVSKELPFYIIEESVLRFFGFQLADGVYLYRPRDRQILPFRGNFVAETATKVKTTADSYRSREFFAGYFLGDDNSESEVNILNKLSGKFEERVDFVVMTLEEGRRLIKQAKLKSVNVPYFYIFRSQNVSHGKWFIQGEDALDYNRVEELLVRVVHGLEDPAA
jgi:hypothetical protein